MTAETIVEIYRTQENRELHSFVAAVTLSYFGRVAMVQALSGTFTVKCWRELSEYLWTKDIDEVHYYRHGKLKVVKRPF